MLQHCSLHTYENIGKTTREPFIFSTAVTYEETLVQPTRLYNHQNSIVFVWRRDLVIWNADKILQIL